MYVYVLVLGDGFSQDCYCSFVSTCGMNFVVISVPNSLAYDREKDIARVFGAKEPAVQK